MKASREPREPAALAANTRINLRLLEIFVRVAEDGSMSAAGGSLGISQAAVSQSITQLEEVLAVQLFDRSVRPPALTLAGSSVLKAATEVLVRLQQLQDVARYAASGRVPLLRIGMLDSFTSTAGAHTLERLKDVASEWTVTSGYRATSFQALVERRSDVIITSDERPVPDSVRATPLLTETFMLALPPDYRGDAGDIAAVAAQLNYIRYGRDSHMGDMIDAYLQRVNAQPTMRYQFDTTDALLRMVAAGFGWTIVTPLILLKSMVPADQVRVVPLPRGTLRRKVVVAVRKGEGEAILERVREAAVDALQQVEPRVRAVVPQLDGRFVIGAGTGRRSRS